MDAHPSPACTHMDPHALALLPLPAVLFDTADKLLGLNSAAASLFGLDPGEAVGQNVCPLMPPDAVPDFHRAVAAARTGGRWTGEMFVTTANGEERLMEVVWGHADGRFVALFTDVTDQRAAVARREQAAARAAVRVLAAGVAAELARPSADRKAVAAQLRALADGPHPDDELTRGTGGQWVLVAADGPLLAAGLRVLLESAGYGVVSADRGTAGTEFRRQRGRSVVAVCDLGTAGPDIAYDLWMVNPRLPVIAVEPERGTVGWPPIPQLRTLPRPVDPAAVLACVAEAFVDVLLNDSANR